MSNEIRFVAKDVVLDPRVGFIGFADEGNRRYLWMQPGEMTTAKNEIWLERDDQAWGGYGEVWNVILTRREFTLITKHLACLACDAIKIQYAVDDERYEVLKALLTKMMIDCPGDLKVQD